MRTFSLPLAAAALLVGCTGPTEPEPKPDLCGESPEGLVCTIAGTGFRGAGGDGLQALQTDLFLPTAIGFTPDGHLIIDDFNNHKIRLWEDDGTLTTLAGDGIHAYAEDGVPATSSGLENPINAQMAPDWTLYIQELHGARILRVDPVTDILTTYAGSAENPGYPDYCGDGGPADEACLSEAGGMALGPDGTLYFADSGNHCIRQVSPDGIIDTVAGDGTPGFVDGPADVARFDQPMDLAVADGALYVVESANSALRRIDLATREVTTLAGTGTQGTAGDGGPGVDAQLNAPRGVGVGPDGAVYVADSGNHAIRRLDPVDGTLTTVVGQLGASGPPGEAPFHDDGRSPEDAVLNWPNDVAVSPAGDLYLVDTMNDRIRRVIGWQER
ncbi:MAG: hypothetical protein R3F59_34060 [Myxococcota bacterium]